MGNRYADHVTPLYPQKKLALTSPTGGGRSVGIVRSRTKATEFITTERHNRSWKKTDGICLAVHFDQASIHQGLHKLQRELLKYNVNKSVCIIRLLQLKVKIVTKWFN